MATFKFPIEDEWIVVEAPDEASGFKLASEEYERRKLKARQDQLKTAINTNTNATKGSWRGPGEWGWKDYLNVLTGAAGQGAAGLAAAGPPGGIAGAAGGAGMSILANSISPASTGDIAANMVPFGTAGAMKALPALRASSEPGMMFFNRFLQGLKGSGINAAEGAIQGKVADSINGQDSNSALWGGLLGGTTGFAQGFTRPKPKGNIENESREELNRIMDSLNKKNMEATEVKNKIQTMKGEMDIKKADYWEGPMKDKKIDLTNKMLAIDEQISKLKSEWEVADKNTLPSWERDRQIKEVTAKYTDLMTAKAQLEDGMRILDEGDMADKLRLAAIDEEDLKIGKGIEEIVGVRTGTQEGKLNKLRNRLGELEKNIKISNAMTSAPEALDPMELSRRIDKVDINSYTFSSNPEVDQKVKNRLLGIQRANINIGPLTADPAKLEQLATEWMNTLQQNLSPDAYSQIIGKMGMRLDKKDMLVNIAALESERDGVKGEIKQVEDMIKQIQESPDAGRVNWQKKQQLDELRARKEALVKEKQGLISAIDKRKGSVKETKVNLEDTLENLGKISEKKTKLEQMPDYEQKAEELRQRMGGMEAIKNATNVELGALSKDRYPGYVDDIKKILELRGTNSALEKDIVELEGEVRKWQERFKETAMGRTFMQKLRAIPGAGGPIRTISGALIIAELMNDPHMGARVHNILSKGVGSDASNMFTTWLKSFAPSGAVNFISDEPAQ